MSYSNHILVVDDDRRRRQLLTKALRRDGYTVAAADSGEQAVQRFAETPFPVVVLDIVLGGMDGLSVLKTIRAQRPETRVIMLTAHASLESAIEALRLGAFDYQQKGPQALEELRIKVQHAFAALGLSQENQHLRRELERAQGDMGLIGDSPAMQELRHFIAQVATADVNVLILGETGTGKELVAKALHAESTRQDKRLVPVGCNIPETLAESLLFGVTSQYPGLHNKEPMTGLFELADGGTLFLDEVGDLPLSVQSKLLRAIQEGEIRPLGAPHTIQVDIRVLAATNRDLTEAMHTGQFRSDLYHRLNVMTLETSPLRHRKADIPVLVQHFLAKICDKLKRPPLQVSDAALEVLVAYDYPGNVRELINLIERAAILTTDDTIRPGVLPIQAAQAAPSDATTPLGDLPLSEARELFERAYFQQQLQHTQGNISQAASRAGIDRKNFRQKMKRYNLSVE